MPQRSSSNDPRIRRTRRLLRQALLELVREKGFEAITVQDLTERAMLNRVTFYLHYRDKHDLLAHSIEDMLNDMAAHVGVPTDPAREPAPDALPMPLVKLFEHVGQHANEYRSLLGEGGVASFKDVMRARIEQLMADQLGQVSAAPPQAPAHITSRFTAAAYLDSLAWWLENDRPYSAEEMAGWLWRLTMRGTAGSPHFNGETPH